MTTNNQFPAATILGYPRIGPRRELKKAVESFWAGNTSSEQLEETAAGLRRQTVARLSELGLNSTDSSIPGSFSYYDQVLDAAVAVGAIPRRFSHLVNADGGVDLDGYFTIARGEGELPPLEMTKWFDSNYHYLVPEIGPETDFAVGSDRSVREFREALDAGYRTRPVLVGPVTFLLLSKPSDESPEGFRPLSRLHDLLPVYAELLRRLADAGTEWVQLDEPGLVADYSTVSAEEVAQAAREAYAMLGDGAARPSIVVAAPYGDLNDALPALAASKVEALALDLVRGGVPRVDADTRAALAGKTLIAGVVDGHNVWRTDLAAAAKSIASVAELGTAVSVSTSTSLLHVPHNLEDETLLSPELASWLAFADQKTSEVVTLATALRDGREAVSDEFEAATRAIASRSESELVRADAVRQRAAALNEDDFNRSSFARRSAAQAEALNLPTLPTTTIGSFPQTSEVRRARSEFRKEVISEAEYEEAMRREIRRVIDLQTEIGLDVLVHGEPERNDMVQYFAENLEGFATTEHGWVQSYGSRCTRPPILFGDVSRERPITVPWARYAQSLTAKPVKGMLTGPVTILAWSFVRDDQPLGETANQVALALRDEVADLQVAGIGIIQVDEPALRELLPLRVADQAGYLEWSVKSFRLATSGVQDVTQIHTHLCYSEFGEVLEAIDGLNADVTSIEAARSRMEILADIDGSGFARGIGPGVYDIHSPRVPTTEEIDGLLTTALRHVNTNQLWVNPDCGLKTRGYAEVEQSLKNLTAAALRRREALVNV
ncbi:5-methyltetrahydropteroyltriglutamate--homocysteine S-methyltransferase [Saxibacter everestensis]|uniref:5-methyltetrahydropteroyltriglutamate--homocysteine methyltransferase n=1 Tax=Saxibacter everestensis TaxID=2909229 RepID=A0ABY8QZR1_9MICO|nr:5-methyltetrahydropteroyltriglutamate--homocysteine S-methyltransferase [Brevibacteriaceae bacterium ZFBP1038]